MNHRQPYPGSTSEVSGLQEVHNSVRHEKIRSDVARRLRKACGYLSDEAFAVLVDKIVEVQLSGERRQREKPS